MKNIASVAIALQTGTPVLMWGSPGCGKTASAYSIAEYTRRPIEVLIGSTREPSDFSGLPIPRRNGNEVLDAMHAMTAIMRAHQDDSTPVFAYTQSEDYIPDVVQAPLAWAKRLSKVKGILFLDEISTCPPAVAAALLRVVLDKVVGEMPLHPDTWMLAAANPPEQAAGGWDLPMPLANRFVHINWSVDNDLWCAGMISGWPTPKIPVLPADWQDHLPQARAMVASYIKTQPTKLLMLPKAESEAGKAWPSPRSWTMAATMLAACKSVGAGIDTQMELIAGCIGNGVGLEFIAWLRDMDLPDPEMLLKDASLLKPVIKEGRGDKIHAALTSLAAVVMQNHTDDRWAAAWDVMALAYEKFPDVATASARVLASRRVEDESKWPIEKIRPFKELLLVAGILNPGKGGKRS